MQTDKLAMLDKQINDLVLAQEMMMREEIELRKLKNNILESSLKVIYMDYQQGDRLS